MKCRLPPAFRIEVVVIVPPPLRLRLVIVPRHDAIGRVMIALGLDAARVKI